MCRPTWAMPANSSPSLWPAEDSTGRPLGHRAPPDRAPPATRHRDDGRPAPRRRSALPHRPPARPAPDGPPGTLPSVGGAAGPRRRRARPGNGARRRAWRGRRPGSAADSRCRPKDPARRSRRTRLRSLPGPAAARRWRWTRCGRRPGGCAPQRPRRRPPAAAR